MVIVMTDVFIPIRRVFFEPERFWYDTEHGAAIQFKFTTVEPENLKITKFQTFHVDCQVMWIEGFKSLFFAMVARINIIITQY